MSAPAGTSGEALPRCGPEDGCITCGDEATPMRVLALDGTSGLALCADPDGVSSEVDLALVEPVEPGSEVLVHAGVALTRLDGGAVAAP